MAQLANMHMLLFTADSLLTTTVTHVARGVGIEVQASDDSQQISDWLNRAKHEGLVLDFDTVSDVGLVLTNRRRSPSSKNAVLFAFATDVKHRERALEGGAHFLLHRPIETEAVRRTLYSAYDLMHGDHKRYFRCAADFPVVLRMDSSGNGIQCRAMNISRNGIAMITPVRLKPAETLQVSFNLPNGVAVDGTAIVIWDDKHGKSGLTFRCSTPEMRQNLDSWLDSHLDSLKIRKHYEPPALRKLKLE